ncbi:MAG: Fic family protein [Candidatus Peregrinibacteria bacterium GW2011_GWF2_38_29]|nr:MAG: Fic family protein [Candidatus Peregrinibacteria bacterium GW2011_GWF2_38_29]HBB03084.1 cell filamentation protein Fic [Candidatus Peregrinibacteria bacterium]
MIQLSKNMIQLTNRQKFILQVIERLGKAATKEIVKGVSDNFDQSSRITVIRDLNILLKSRSIRKIGNGRNVAYEALIPKLQRSFDLIEYFKKEPDKREVNIKKLDFKSKIDFENLFSKKELLHIKNLTEIHSKRFKSYNREQIKKELERITIEFSWRSSHIEGNTYTLLDTERLMKSSQEAKGKTHEEAVMILNHKTALYYIWDKPKYFKTVSLKKIEELHDMISKGLKIPKGLRRRPVGIIGTAYKPYDNIYQIREAVEALCGLLNNLKNPFISSMIAVAALSYIQPFEDGNKRTSRMLGNAILLANGYCPLSYRSVDEIEYKKAIILFYEQHSLTAFKKLFIEQYEFAVKNYF